MTLELPVPWIITLNVLGWPLVQLAMAWVWTRVPHGWLCAPDACLFEADGRFYQEAFRIKSWKDLLPDAAPWFRTGFAKASLQATDPAYLQRFIRETWRGELCHWSAIAFTPVFLSWNPWWGDLVIVAYALAANLPCILVQRHNRIRLRRLLVKSRGGPASHASG